MTAGTANFSELVQRSTETVARMQRSPGKALLLRRRGADEDLYLTTAERAEQTREVVDSTTRMFLALMRSNPAAVEMLTQIFPEAFPWVRFLPEDAVREFLIEFMETAHAASDLGTMAPLASVIAAWKSTAEIYADPDLAATLKAPVDDDLGPVEQPSGEGTTC